MDPVGVMDASGNVGNSASTGDADAKPAVAHSDSPAHMDAVTAVVTAAAATDAKTDAETDAATAAAALLALHETPAPQADPQVAAAATARTALTTDDVLAVLVGMPDATRVCVREMIEGLANTPTKAMVLSLLKRLFQTHGAYVYHRNDAEKRRKHAQALFAQTVQQAAHIARLQQSTRDLGLATVRLRGALHRALDALPSPDKRHVPRNPKPFQ